MQSSRRSFLKMGPALAAVGMVPSAAFAAPKKLRGEASETFSSFDPWVEIHRDHLAHNVSQIARRVAGRPILAVIKNNGYGMGVVNAATLLEPSEAIHGFAVVKLQEAVALRDSGILKPVLLMGPFDEKNLEDAVALNITPMIYTPMGKALDRIAGKRQSPVGIQICVDTGIGRVGVPLRQAPELIRDLAGRSSVRVEGTMMTFTEDPDFDKKQLRRFELLTDELSSDGVPLGRKHAASSFALFQNPDAFLDMVRPGMAIYGVYSEQEFRTSKALALRPALALKARVAYVKKLQKGESAGYNRAYMAQENVWVATLPVGHADGLPRAAANSANVRIGNRLYPIVASVSASHCIAEIGPEPLVRIGDVATIFDWQEGSRPEDLSLDCGSSVYDLTMHLNPLLPRRMV